MPELPEVETVRAQLQRALIGQTIKTVEVFHPKSVAHDENFEDTLVGKTIADIDRVGKLMIFSFVDQPDLFLLAHLKMTGQFFFQAKKISGHRMSRYESVIGGGHSMTEADIAELPGQHTRVALYFTDDSALYFNDMRLFGYIKLATATEVAKARQGFGPEPIDPEFDLDWFVDAVRKRHAPIKAVLLDQKFIAGLGNIYVDEALWRAQVRPSRTANKLTKKEARELGFACGDVMNESIKVKGTTFQSFRDTDGHAGNFTQYLKVFGKQGTNCPRCNKEIVKTRLVGRGTHYCPGCQK